MNSNCNDDICVIDEQAIEVQDLKLSYQNRLALKGINLSVSPCTVTALIGPSGCGKTSFLNCINRMTDYFDDCRVDGQVNIHGENILSKETNVIKLRRKIGMIFQKPNPFPLSISRNISMPLRYHRVKDSKLREEIVEKSLNEVGLWDEVKDRLNTQATLLSGGQQQRLCIARAIALEPEILLMDEPCSALDPQSSSTIESLIELMRNKFTLIVVTHNIAQAKRISDKTVIFWNYKGYGEIVEDGPTEQVFCKPSNKTAQAYIEGHLG